MPIPLDPANYEYAAGDCLTCYPAGLTPKYLYVCLAGILTGDTWNPAVDPPPPNGIHKLEYDNACDWDLVEDGIGYGYSSGAVVSVLNVLDGIRFYFVSDNMPVCTTYFTNLFVTPAGKEYYGGWAFVTQIEPDGLFSETELANLAGIVPGIDTVSTVWPKETDEAVHVLYDIGVNSRIRILYDHT